MPKNSINHFWFLFFFPSPLMLFIEKNSIEKKKRAEPKTNKTQERTASIRNKIKYSNNTINSNHKQTLKKNNETNLVELEFVCDVDAERSVSNRKKNNVKNESIKTGRVE